MTEYMDTQPDHPNPVFWGL